MLSEAKKRANKKYRQSEKGKAVAVHADKRHYQTEKGKATSMRYAQSKKGKIVKARASARHSQTVKGKITNARIKTRRKRDLGYNPINEWFLGCHGHHINKNDVLHIPKELHKSIKHSQDDLASMEAINNVAFEWLCAQEII